MPRAILALALAVLLAVAGAGEATAASAPATRPAVNVAVNAAGSRPELLALRGGFHLGGYRSRGYGYGYGGYGRGRPRSSLLHRVVKTAIWLYILHLFFSHGGLSILLWLIIIGLVFSLVRRRRRYAYGPQSSWR